MKYKFVFVGILFILFMLFIVCYYRFFSFSQESFLVPKKIKETYRPINRKIRMTYESFYAKSTTNISTFLRKMGMI